MAGQTPRRCSRTCRVQKITAFEGKNTIFNEHPVVYILLMRHSLLVVYVLPNIRYQFYGLFVNSHILYHHHQHCGFQGYYLEKLQYTLCIFWSFIELCPGSRNILFSIMWTYESYREASETGGPGGTRDKEDRLKSWYQNQIITFSPHNNLVVESCSTRIGVHL